MSTQNDKNLNKLRTAKRNLKQEFNKKMSNPDNKIYIYQISLADPGISDPITTTDDLTAEISRK